MHYPVQELYTIRDTEDAITNSVKNFLSIELSPDGFSFCVLDSNRFRYTLLKSYVFESSNDYDKVSLILEDLAKDKKELSSYYQRISVCMAGPGVTLVPTGLFSYLEKKNIIDFTMYPDTDYEIKVDKLNNLDAYAIYPFPRLVLQKVNYLFPGCRIRHLSSCLIENITYLLKYGNVNADTILHVQKGHFEILIFKDKNLTFYNSFNYQTWDDLLYYLFFVFEQLALQPEEADAMIFGEVSIESDLYKKLRRYVKSLEFGPRNDMYKYSEAFDQIPHHYFYNLLNLNACG